MIKLYNMNVNIDNNNIIIIIIIITIIIIISIIIIIIISWWPNAPAALRPRTRAQSLRLVSDLSSKAVFALPQPQQRWSMDAY